VNSAAPGPIFIQIYGFEGNPLKYTDPNGKHTSPFDTRDKREKVGKASNPGPCQYGTLLGAAQEYAEFKNKSQYTMRIINGHRNLGDKNGNFIWESMEYNSESNIKKGKADSLRYIHIEPKPNADME
jgi:hypothetical protein